MDRTAEGWPTPPANILLVDDQAANLLSLEAVLQDLGQNLVMAHSGEEALRQLLGSDYAVILLDVQMTGMDGFETARLIRGGKRHRHTPIIFLTAYETNRLPISEAYALGAVDYLIKPIVPEVLRSKVKVFVELHRKSAQVRLQAEQLHLMERRAFELKLAEERQSWELDHLREEADKERDLAKALAQKAEELAILYRDLQEEMAERRRIEAQLRRSQTELTDFVDNAPVGMHWIGPDGTIIWANQTELALLGYRREDYVGRPGRDFHADPHALEALLRRLHAGEVVQNCEAQLLCQDSSVRDVLIDANVLWEEGQFVHARCFTRDVTAQKRAEEERRRLQQRVQNAQKLESLGVLAGGIAHDFNNLLTGILGHAGLALEELPAGSPAHNLIRQIETAGQRAADLTRQMLAYSGKGRFIVRPVDLCHVIRDMSPLVQTVIGTKVTLHYDCPNDLPAVQADAAQVRQVLLSLITNASEAIGDRAGAITVSLRPVQVENAARHGFAAPEGLTPGAYVALEVGDTGCGMEPAMLDKIFDPFFTTKFTGRGLGLAAVLGIVRGHRGSIQVQSVPGQGSIFQVLLPCASRSGRKNSEVAVEERGKGRSPALVIEDEQALRAAPVRL